MGRILPRGAFEEGKLHDFLVGFARAENAVMRPNRSAHPLPLLDDVRVCFLDQLAHSAESFPAPVPEFGDSFRDELRCRLTFQKYFPLSNRNATPSQTFARLPSNENPDWDQYGRFKNIMIMIDGCTQNIRRQSKQHARQAQTKMSCLPMGPG